MSSIIQKTELPGPKSIALMERRRKAIARGPFHVTPVFSARAKGALIEDVDGNQFIDFAGGIGVANVGHCSIEVLAAVQDQLERFHHVGFNVTPYEGYVQLAEKLNEITPGAHAKKTFLANSGAEAVENAIKIARAYTGRQAVICFEHAFHGRTYMAMSLTAKARFKQGFAPFNPEVYRVPFPYVYRWPGSPSVEVVARECFRQFSELATTQLSPGDIAAVIIEPVLGEGGFVPAPREFLKALSDFCANNGILLIADEIQTGFGRTGTLFASEKLGLVPDIITMAKGLGGGFPLSAVTGRAEIMDAAVEGSIGGTYGGSPVACAAALAVIDKFLHTDLLARAEGLGEVLLGRMKKWQRSHDFIGDVRGLGPMLAMEFVKNRETREPDADRTKALISYAYQHGVILMSAGTFANVVRFLMPLIISPEDLEEGLAVIEQGLEKIE
jgi:4-aminobutyrate aminotransferase / (S)-3-amino-2-methylpropionate transaminase / 5-aminovalerate transaminase